MSPRLLVCLFAITAPACGEEPQPAQPMPTPKAAAPAAPTAAPTAETPATAAPVWSYSPVGKRDPFRSYLSALGSRKHEDSGKKLQPTETYELDQYRLTGIITGTAQPKAMVEDPAGKGHVLRIGTKLGKNGGRVKRIIATHIVITEETRAPTGERIRVPITIKLPKSELNFELEP